MTSSTRRILYVEGNVDGTIGGSFFSLLFLVSGLDRTRFEPVVVFAAENALQPRFHEAGIRTVIRPLKPAAAFRGPLGRLLNKGINFIRGWITEPLRLARLMRSEGIELVHLNNSIVANHSWMIAAAFARLPCITHERGINNFFPARARRMGSRLDAVICISAAVRDNFIAHGLTDLKLVTIYNGLAAEKFRPMRSPAEVRAELGIHAAVRLVGIVGNIKPWKGQEVVIRAIGELAAEFPDLKCLLIGDTSTNDLDYREKVLTLMDELGVRDRIVVTGYRSDVGDFVNALEIQVHASVQPEPFGRVLLEAMALEKPLVASGGGAVPEIVVDGTTGLLFEPGNAGALAAALRTLLADPGRAALMGREGRSRLDAHFSIVRNVADTQALYDRLLTAR